MFNHFYIVINIKENKFLLAFGLNLKKHRKAASLTQEELAYDSNIPVSQVGRIERGEINTTISSLLAISKALNKKVEDLFDFEY